MMPDDENYIETEVTGFTPAPDAIAQDLGPSAALVWGQVWRYSRMKHRVCRASQSRIADRIGMSRKTVGRLLQELLEAGYIIDLTPDWVGKQHQYIVSDRIVMKGQFEATENPDWASTGRGRAVRDRRERRSHKASKYTEFVEH